MPQRASKKPCQVNHAILVYLAGLLFSPEPPKYSDAISITKVFVVCAAVTPHTQQKINF
jgi:hypothetical protein